MKNNKGLMKGNAKYFVFGMIGLMLIGAVIAGDTVITDSSVTSDGATFNGLVTIDQDGDGEGLFIDSEATTAGNYGLHVNTGQGARNSLFYTTADQSIWLGRNDASGDVYVYRDLNAGNTSGALMFIEQDNAGDDQHALRIQNDGSGRGISVSPTGSGAGVYIGNSGTGDSLNIEQNGNICKINVDTDGTCDAGTALVVDNSIAICAVCS